MNETLLRLAVVAGALLIALTIALILGRRRQIRPRLIQASNLGPGFYFFSSSDCDSCHSARRVLDDELGAGGYVELSWDRRPGEFSRYGVEEVPAFVVVDPDGKAMLYAGQPQDALRSFSP